MAGPEEKIWNTQYGQVRAVLVPKSIYTMAVRMKVHHLEDLVSTDQGWARNRFDMEHKGASKYIIGIAWFYRHSKELFCLRAKPAPEWQEAPEQWQPLRIHPRTSKIVVGGRDAKKEQTKVVVQGSYHLQVDKEYLDNRPATSPLCVPMCHTGNKGPYLNLRVYRSLVYFYQVQSQCNAGPYTSFWTGVRDEAAAMRYIRRTCATIVWLTGPPDPAYWEHAAELSETTVTIASTRGPHGIWVDIPQAEPRKRGRSIKSSASTMTARDLTASRTPTSMFMDGRKSARKCKMP